MKMQSVRRGFIQTTFMLGLVATLCLTTISSAADIALSGDDAFGQSSFNSGQNWTGGQTPASGNDYFTNDFRLRTPPDAGSYTFAGDSLTINNTNGYSWGLMYKGTGDTGVLTINNLILDGGMISHGNGLGDLCQLDGNIFVNSESTFYAKQGNIDVLADVSGAGNLIIAQTDSPGEDARYVSFFSTNTGFTGNLDVSGRFRLEENAGLSFTIGANGVNNSISGTGSAVLNGVFSFDLTNASANEGDSWAIVSVSSLSFGATFSVDGFTESIPGVWETTDYWFETATGTLHYGESPASEGVYLNAGGDPMGTSSFDNDLGNNWDDGLDPSPGKDYIVTVNYLRTPVDAIDYTFQGDTLTLKAGGAIISKHTASRTLTANWILDGGLIRSGSWGDPVETLEGVMEITSNGGEIRADQTAYVVNADITGDKAGTLTLAGGFDLTIAGINDFAGNVNATGSNVVWQTGSEWTFYIGASGENNQITGSGTVSIDGTLNIDLAGAGDTPGDTWKLIDVANLSYGENFSVPGFSETTPGIWGSGNYLFYQQSGVLSYGEVPGSWDGDVSDLWSVAENWTGDILPDFFGFNSKLTFSDPSAVSGTIINDVVGAELGSIVFAPGVKQFVLTGEAIEISGAIENANSNGQEIDFDVLGNLEFDASIGPITMSGVLSSTNGLIQAGEADLILSNSGNDFSGPVNFDGLGSIVVAASGALGDPASEVEINAYYAGPLATLEFDGIAAQEKIYEMGARTVSDPMHILVNSNGVATMDGEINLHSGGDRFLFLAETGSTLTINADLFMWDDAYGLDIIRCDGDGTITINGDLDDTDDDGQLGVLKANGDVGTLNLVGPKTYTGDTVADSGTLALIDAASSNNVVNSDLLLIASTNGLMDFSGLAGGGIVLTADQTLAGLGDVFGGVTAPDGSVIEPGNNGIGTLGIENLTLEEGATINIDLGTPSDSIMILAGGSLTGPSTGQVMINIDASGVLSTDPYVILDWTGATAVDVNIEDFFATAGTLEIINSQLLLTVEIVAVAETLVADTGNDRILSFDVSQFGGWVQDSENPVFADSTTCCGPFPMESPGALVKDAAGNIYVAETNPDVQDRVVKLDSDGNYLDTLAEVDAIDPSDDISGTPHSLAISPDGAYLFLSIAQPNSTATGTPDLDDVIYRIDLSGATSPQIYIDTTDVDSTYVLEDPKGLAFGPDGYLYVSNNLDPAGLPDGGSRVLRFDVSGSTGVFAGVLTTDHADTKGLYYDSYYERLLVSLNDNNDIWAYNDLTLDFVAVGDPSHETVFEQGSGVDYPAVISIAGTVYFSNTTDDVIQRVDAADSAPVVVDSSAAMVDPSALLVVTEYDRLDFNYDGVVDQEDAAIFISCIAGPNVLTPPDGVTFDVFVRADFDGDGDVDMQDVATFSDLFVE